MSHLETPETHLQAQVVPVSSSSVRSKCPDCKASLAVLRVIGGRADCEYWTMRCTRCGGLHLEIVKASPDPVVA
jgi:phage FluMu protein Com